MTFLINIALGTVLLINAIGMIEFYDNIIISVVALSVFTFLYLLLVVATSKDGS